MRRRRQKNTLLPKMIGIAVIINAILLPILSQLGVFKAKKGSFTMTTKLVDLPPEKKKEIKKPPKPKVAKAKARPSSHRNATHMASAHIAKPNPNAPKVVTSGSGDGGNGPAVDSGQGDAGVVPAAAPPTPAPAAPPTQQAAEPAAPVTPPAAPAPPAAPVKPAEPKPEAPPRESLVVQAKPLNEPRPQVPEDLLSSFNSDFNGACLILFAVHADGTATPKLVQGTGNSALDDLALQCARKWTFQPGMKDGVPVESYLRLKLEFEVTS